MTMTKLFIILFIIWSSPHTHGLSENVCFQCLQESIWSLCNHVLDIFEENRNSWAEFIMRGKDIYEEEIKICYQQNLGIDVSNIDSLGPARKIVMILADLIPLILVLKHKYIGFSAVIMRSVVSFPVQIKTILYFGGIPMIAVSNYTHASSVLFIVVMTVWRIVKSSERRLSSTHKALDEPPKTLYQNTVPTNNTEKGYLYVCVLPVPVFALMKLLKTVAMIHE